MASVFGGCDESATRGSEPAESEVLSAASRAERFAALRDLVWFERPAEAGGGFWIDRFETTCSDWEVWLTLARRPVSEWLTFQRWNPPPRDGLPVVGVDLAEARRYAGWRGLRLQRFEEWEYAATAGSRYRLPWGDAERDSWANTLELRLGRLVPVGTFESGRQPGGPYDLIGNVGEWTETPWDDLWFPAGAARRGEQLPLPLVATWHRAAAHPAFRGFLLRGQPVPVSALLLINGRRLPRKCSAGFDRPMIAGDLGGVRGRDPAWRSVRRLPNDRGSTVGVRLATDPVSLLLRLASIEDQLTAVEQAEIRDFVARTEGRGALRDAAVRHRSQWEGGRSPALAVVLAELGL